MQIVFDIDFLDVEYHNGCVNYCENKAHEMENESKYFPLVVNDVHDWFLVENFILVGAREKLNHLVFWVDEILDVVWYAFRRGRPRDIHEWLGQKVDWIFDLVYLTRVFFSISFIVIVRHMSKLFLRKHSLIIVHQVKYRLVIRPQQLLIVFMNSRPLVIIKLKYENFALHQGWKTDSNLHKLR